MNQGTTASADAADFRRFNLRESGQSADKTAAVADRALQQLGLFAEDRTIAQRFEEWKATPGGAQVLNRAYRIAAGFVPRFRRTGQQVSMDYIWHILRYRIAAIKRELRRRQIELGRERGFALNNDFTAYVARHIVAHRPEWEGLFEIREVGGRKSEVRRKVVVIEETRPVLGAQCKGKKSKGDLPQRHRDAEMGNIEHRTFNAQHRRDGSVPPAGGTAEYRASRHAVRKDQGPVEEGDR